MHVINSASSKQLGRDDALTEGHDQRRNQKIYFGEAEAHGDPSPPLPFPFSSLRLPSPRSFSFPVCVCRSQYHFDVAIV